MARLRTTLAAALLALAAAAPAGAAAPSEPEHKDLVALDVTPERQAATEFALVLAMTRSYVSAQCASVPETKDRAASALAGWRARNQYLVQPLLPWVNYAAGIDAKDADEQKANVQQAIVSYKAKAVTLARLELGTDTPDAAACNTALARFEDPSKDLARSAHGPHLEAIRAYIQALESPPRRATQ